MTAVPHTRWTVWCDAPSCPATWASDHDTSRAKARRILAKSGWTTGIGDGPIKTRKDFCPEHKPAPEMTP